MNGGLWKLSLSLLKRRRRSMFALMSGIGLSVALVCTLVVSAMSLSLTMKEHWNQSLGAQYAVLLRVDAARLREAAQRYGASGLNQIDLAGVVFAPGRQGMDDRALVLGNADDTTLRIVRVSPEEGRMPQQSGEIALERNALLRLNRQGKLGDAATLSVVAVGQEGFAPQAVEKAFTVVGILPNRSRLRNSHLSNSESAELGWPNAYVSADDAAGVALCHGIISDPAIYDQSQKGPLIAAIEELAGPFPQENLSVSYEARQGDFSILMGGRTPQFGGYAGGGLAPVYLLVPLALVVMAACGIAGAFAADLRSRGRQLALMRAIGATRHQVVAMTLGQAAIVFLPAAPAGVLLSFALTGAMLRIVGSLLNMTVVLWRSWAMVFGALGISLIVSLISALLPALRLSRLAPVQAVKLQDSARRRSVARRLPSYTKAIAPRLLARQLRLRLGSLLTGTLVMGLSIAACAAVWMVAAVHANGWAHAQDYLLQDYETQWPYTSSLSGLPVTAYQELELKDADFTRLAELAGIEQYVVDALVDGAALLLDAGEGSSYVRQMVDYAPIAYNDLGEPHDPEVLKGLGIAQDTLIAAIDVHALDDATLRRLIGGATALGSIDLEAMRRGEAALACLPPTVYQILEQTQEGHTYQFAYYGFDTQYGPAVENTTIHVGDRLPLLKLYALAEQLLSGERPTVLEHRMLTPTLAGLLDLGQLSGILDIRRPALVLHRDALRAWDVAPRSQTVFLTASPDADDLSLEDELLLHFGDRVSVVSKREQEQRTRRISSLINLIGFSVLGFVLLLTTLWALNRNAALLRSSRRDYAILRALGLSETAMSAMQLTGDMLQVAAATALGIIGSIWAQNQLFPSEITGQSVPEPIPWALLAAIAGGLFLTGGVAALLAIRARRREGLAEQIRMLD